MFPRWLWLNHVPPGIVLTSAQKAEVSRRVREMGPGQRRFTALSWRMLVRLIPAMLGLLLAFAAWLVWLIRARPAGGMMISLNLAGILLFQVLVWVIIAWSINRAIGPLVWRALNQIGIRICEGCGYVLQYHPAEARNCPECGEALVPPTEPSIEGQSHGFEEAPTAPP